MGWSIARFHSGESADAKTPNIRLSAISAERVAETISLLLAFHVCFCPESTLVGCPLKERAFFVYPKRCAKSGRNTPEKGSDARYRAPRDLFPRGLKWSGRQDLNLRPLVPQTSALPSCATTRYFRSFVPPYRDPRLSRRRRAYRFFGTVLFLESATASRNPLPAVNAGTRRA